MKHLKTYEKHKDFNMDEIMMEIDTNKKIINFLRNMIYPMLMLI